MSLDEVSLSTEKDDEEPGIALFAKTADLTREEKVVVDENHDFKLDTTNTTPRDELDVSIDNLL